MYREAEWEKGYYVDNHKKYVCCDCERQFIIGEKQSEDCPPGFPVCPYCGQANVACVAWTEDDQLEELSSNLGCITITGEI